MIKLKEIFKKKNVLPQGKFVHRRKHKMNKWVLYPIIGIFAFFILGALFEGGDDDSDNENGEFILKREQPKKISMVKKEVLEVVTQTKEMKETQEVKKDEKPKRHIEYLDLVLNKHNNE